jgi:hypothetical protein
MRLLLIFAAVVLTTSETAPAQVILFREDFENVPLAEPVEEGTPPTTPGVGVVTPVPPPGWTVDRSQVAGINNPDSSNGVIDFAGWTFADRDWWSRVDNQLRDQFTNASGTIAVADNDEWDDQPHPGNTAGGNPDLRFTSFLSRTAASIGNIPADRVNLVFDSSWRPEFDTEWGTTIVDGQEGVVRVSFDGGPETEILHWTSLASDSNFHGDSTNETVSLQVPNPANFSQMTVTFGLLNAQNDWWWAIDNVTAFVQAMPATLTMNRITGEAVIAGGDVL